MSDSVKLDHICPLCESTPSQDQCVECFFCNSIFHASCEKWNNEANLARKSMVKTYLAASTKSKFKFFCDPCLTKLEVNMVETESQKMCGLETKVNAIEGKLDEITKLLKETRNLLSKPVEPVLPSIWHNKEKLESIKAPPYQTNTSNKE